MLKMYIIYKEASVESPTCNTRIILRQLKTAGGIEYIVKNTCEKYN